RSFLREKVRFGSWSLPYLVAVALGALGYFVLAKLSLYFASASLGMSPIWPASGFGVVLVRFWGRRMWPGIFVGAFLPSMFGDQLDVVVLTSAGSALEAVVGGMILSYLHARYSDNFMLARLLGIVLAALWAALVGTAIGIAAFSLLGSLTSDHLGEAWFTWWVGDALGILIMTPALLAVREPYGDHLGAPRTLIRIGALTAAIALALAMSRIGSDTEVAIFLVFPIVVLAGHWFGLRGASWSVLGIAMALTAMTANGMGTFVEAALNDSLIDMQAFLGILAIVSLMFVDLKPLTLRLPLGVLMVGVAMAAGAFVVERRDARHLDDLRFGQLVQTASDHVRQRMAIYTNGLRAGASMYQASERVTRKEWRDFAASLELMERYPGIYGLGVVVPVEPQHLAEFLVWERFDGAPDLQLKIYPGAVDPRAPDDDHFVALYVEPESRNSEVIGMDMASEAKRRAAAIAARDTGQPAITGQLALFRDPRRRPAFLFFLPVYKGLDPLSTVQERRDRLRGWIFAPFITEDFFRAALVDLANEIHAEVFEGDAAAPEHFLFSTFPSRSADALSSGWRSVTSLQLVDQTFTIRWHAGAGFVAESRRNAVLVSCTIVLLAMLLAALVANLQSLRQRATALAEDMTKALAASNERLRAAISVMEDGFGLFDADDRVIVHNEPFMDAGSRKSFGNTVTGRKFEEIVRAFVYNDMPVTDPNFD
ncbi:MAG TPA: CHASE domain-containing protein, partial [Dongiaceae bacterium]